MLGPAIRPMRQYPAMRQVGKAQTKGHRGPRIYGGEHHEHAADDPQQIRVGRKPPRPILRAMMIIQWAAIIHENEGRIANERRHPSCHIRSEEHTSELQSLMRISYAVF